MVDLNLFIKEKKRKTKKKGKKTVYKTQNTKRETKQHEPLANLCK